MKKILAVLLACTMVLGMTACGGTSKSSWSEKDLTFKSESGEKR